MTNTTGIMTFLSDFRPAPTMMMENAAAVGASDKKPSQITTLTEISETLSPKPKSRSSSCFIVEQEARPTTEDERFQFDARKSVRKILSLDPTNLPTMTATEQEDFDNVLIDNLVRGPALIAQEVVNIWMHHPLPEVPVIRYPQGYLDVSKGVIEAHISCEGTFVPVKDIKPG